MKPRIISATRLSFPLAAAIAALLTTHSAQAQTTRYWDGNNDTTGFGGASGTWAAPTTGTATAGWSTSATGEDVVLGNSITTAINDPLHFGTDAVGNGLGGGTILVSGTVHAASLRFGSQTFGNVILSGGVINLAEETTIHVGAGSTTVHTISSQITGAATSLTKTGNTLNLSGANTYTGSTIISAGKLILSNVNALGTSPGVNGTSGISMVAGTTLQANITGVSVAAPITLSGVGNINIAAGTTTAVAASFTGAIGGSTGNLVFTTLDSNSNPAHVITLGAASNYTGNTNITAGNAANNLTVRNAIANALPTTTVLSLTGGNGSGSGRTLTYDLGGFDQTVAGLTNTIVGTSARNHRITNSGALATLTINNTSNFTYGGVGTSTTFNSNPVNPTALITGAIALTKSGAGTFTLAAGAANTYTGATQIDGGILVFGNKAAKSASTTVTAAAAGSVGLGVHDTTATFYSAIEVGDLFNTNTLAGFNLNAASGVAIDTTSAGGSFDQNVALTAARSLTKVGNGVLTLSQANSYSGLTTVNAGVIRVTNASGLGTTAGGTAVNGVSGGTNVARVELSGNIAVTGEAITITGAGNFRGALSSFSGTNEWAGNVTIDAADTRIGASDGATLEVSGVIDSGANSYGLNIRNGLVSAGGGVILSGANTYLGDTSLFIGKLQLDGGDNRLPVATKLSIGTGANTAEFDLNGLNQEIAGLSLVSGSTAANNTVTNLSPTLSTLTVNTAATVPSTYGGVLAGNLALTKTGVDSLTLTGATNTYAGATTVSAGTLLVTGALSNSAVSVQSAGAIGGSGSLGSGLTILAGGNLDLNGATLAENSTGILTATSLTLGNLTFEDLVGWNWMDADAGTYELIDGGFTVTFGSTAFLSEETAYDFGNGKSGYFTSGGLNAVIVIPEPSAALLGCIGALLLLRRRR